MLKVFFSIFFGLSLFALLLLFVTLQLKEFMIIIIVLGIIKINNNITVFIWRRKLRNALKAFYSNNYEQSKQVKFMQVYLKEIFFLLQNPEKIKTEREFLTDLIFYQITQNKEAFKSLLIDQHHVNALMIREYFKLNFQTYKSKIFNNISQQDIQEFLFYINYLLTVFNNKYLAYLKIQDILMKSQKLNGILNLFFLLYITEIDILQENMVDYENSSVNNMVLLKLYKKIELLRKFLSKCTSLMKHLWLDLQSNTKEEVVIQASILRIFRYKESVSKIYEEITKQHKNNFIVLYLYAMFQYQVLDNQLDARKLFYRIKAIIKNIQVNINFNLSSFQKFGENSNSSVIVADGSIENIGKINNVFFNFKEFLGYEKHELLDHKINLLIPEVISKRHDQIIFSFYQRGYGKFVNKDRIVFAIHKNSFIFPAEILLRIMITYSFGIKLVLFMNRDINFLKTHFAQHHLFEQDLVYFILFDENKEICELSYNLKHGFQLTNEQLLSLKNGGK